MLNFGHTIGHAVESISLQTNSPRTHGESVMIGMIVETIISAKLGILSTRDEQIIIKRLLPFIDVTDIASLDEQLILSLIMSDKKKVKKEVAWTLLSSIGKGVINNTVPSETVVLSIRTLKGIL